MNSEADSFAYVKFGSYDTKGVACCRGSMQYVNIIIIIIMIFCVV